MHQRPLRKTLAIAAAFGAALVCLQVGAIHVRQRGSEALLAEELAALRSGQAAEIAAAREELARAEAQVARLQRELAQAESASSQLDAVLREADAAREELAAKLGAAARALDSERPFLDVTVAPFDSSTVLAAIAENRGAQPLSVRESSGWFWVDGAPLALEGSLAPMRIEPGGEADVFEWDAAAHALELVEDSELPVRGGLCFVYARMLEDETAAWVEERWFEYRPASGSTATLQRDTWPLLPGSPGCAVGDVEPPW